MFKRIDEDEALIVENGVFKPVEVYEGPNGGLYVKAKGGFLRVKSNGSTSSSGVRLESLHREGDLFQDDFSRLCVTPTGPGSKRKQVFIRGDGADMKMLTNENQGAIPEKP